MGVGRNRARVVDVAEAERARMPWLLLTDEETGTSWLVLDVIARADEDAFGVDDEEEKRRRLDEADREEMTWDAREAREGASGR